MTQYDRLSQQQLSFLLYISGTDLISLVRYIIILFLLGRPLQKGQGFVVSNLIGIKFAGIVLQENTHRLESDDVTISRWRSRRHFTQKCCRLMSIHTASARRLCSSVRQFLIYTTFALVLRLISSDVLDMSFCSKNTL